MASMVCRRCRLLILTVIMNLRCPIVKCKNSRTIRRKNRCRFWRRVMAWRILCVALTCRAGSIKRLRVLRKLALKLLLLHLEIIAVGLTLTSKARNSSLNIGATLILSNHRLGKCYS